MLLVLIGAGSLVFGLVAGWSLIVPAMAFAIIVLALVYTIGPISGCHINPAVSIGVWSIGGMKTKDMVIYVIMQFLGGILGAAILYGVFLDGNPSSLVKNFGSTGYLGDGIHIYSAAAVFVVEVISAFILQIVILGSLGNKSNSAVAGVAIGLTVGGIILFTGAIDGAGINPIRDMVALFAGGKYAEQLWLFIVAPIIGGIIGSWVWKYLGSPEKAATA
jgi:aquaporin Z